MENSHDGRRLAAQRMKRILLHFRARMDEELRPQGVTTSQLQVMKAIKSSPGSSGAHLARVCYVTPQTVQALIYRLEKDGWIVRQKDKGNDRILGATLTVAGEELIRTAAEVVAGLEERLWAGVPEDDVVEFNRVLERCLGNIGVE